MEETIDPNKIFRQILYLNDESELAGSAYSSSDLTTLHVRLDEQYSMIDMFPIFTDPDKISTIRSVMYSANSHSIISDETYRGYTQMVGIRMDGKQVSVSLRKPLSGQ